LTRPPWPWRAPQPRSPAKARSCRWQAAAIPWRRSITPAQRTILGAIAAEQRLRLSYVDRGGAATQRIVWPIALEGDMLAAWCETRRDYRHFRLDRMRRIQSTGTPMPERRRVLLAGWLRHRSEQGEW